MKAVAATSAKSFKQKMAKRLRDDANYMYVAAWKYNGDSNWELNKEDLDYELIKPSKRNYK